TPLPSEARMRTRSFVIILLMAILTSPALAQDVQTNPPDNASATLNNSTCQSETNHAVTPNGVIVAWNDSSQIPTLGTLANFVASAGSTTGATFSSGEAFLNARPTSHSGAPASLSHD